jgi:deoxyribonuclease-2
MAKLSALNDVQGTAVDWWFMYKYPNDIGPNGDSTGFEYLFMDSTYNKEPQLSPVTLDHDQCAVALTLIQVFTPGTSAGYVLWNDEIPPTKDDPNPKDKGSLAHSKGILGFDKSTDSGFYLLHSTPRFPAANEIDLPDMEDQYGQTYLCISIDYATANTIAEVLRTQHEVQVYANVLTGVDDKESIALLANQVMGDVPTEPAAIDIATRGGQKLKFFGKNKKWSEAPKGQKAGKDFWSDLVGPALEVNLNVETWRRGTVFSDVDEDFKGDTEDILSIDLAPVDQQGYGWPFTKDHAKWGMSEDKTQPWVIIADINRNVSQENRGGGGLAFSNPILWAALDAIEKSETTVETGIHTDKAPS